MGDANPFSPSSTLTFLTGLTSETMNEFKRMHDEKQQEDEQAKKMDFELLMASLEHLKPTLTPSQAREILTRASDIYKPKGGGDIKARLGEIFGTGPVYQSQAGTILQQAAAKPRMQIGTENADTGDTTPSVFGPPGNQVTLPAPPGPEKPVYEKTFGEMSQQDKLDLIDAQTEKVAASEDLRQQHRLAILRERNKGILDRFKEEQGIKDDAIASRKLRERASYFGDPDDPVNLERARGSLQGELEQKQQLGQSRIEYQKTRLQQIDRSLNQSQQRIQAQVSKLGAGKAADFNKDPQVKGAWAKVNESINLAKQYRAMAAERYAKQDTAAGQELEERAERAETNAQDIINTIEQRIQNYLVPRAGGVTLPNPPGRKGGAVKRSGVKLTEAEIRARGGSDADVQEARQKGYLVP